MTNFKRTTAITQNETRENIMFGHDFSSNEQLTTNNVLRLLSWAACLVLALALLQPTPALAQNECGGDPVLDIGDDTYNCPDASYPDGVTYDADGNLTVNFTNGSVTEVEDVGIDLSATGTDSITFDSATTDTEIESRAVTGPLLSVTTVDGDIDIDTEQMEVPNSQTPDNVTHAIYAESTGSGSIDIGTTANINADAGNAPDDSIGIEAITGSGDLTITASARVFARGAGIAATTGTGLLTINLNSGATVRGRSFGPTTAVDVTTAGQAVLNNSGIIGGTGNELETAIRAGGDGSLIINNDSGGRINGVVDLSGLGGGYVFNNDANALWTSVNSFGAQGIKTQISSLGAGTLNNAGTIALGLTDVIMAPGTDYVGDGGVLEFETIPGRTGQADCTSPTISGCFYLPGGSTGGTTAIRPVFLEVQGQESPAAANAGIVLVDVNGGSSSADHFMLDSTVEGYSTDPVYGSVIDLGGVLDYALLYNPDNQQHVLATVPQREGVEYVSFIHEALSIWHTTSDAVAGRQSALRDGGERGAWFRITGEQTSREASPTFSHHGNDFTYEQEYSLWTGAAIAGFDITASDEHVFGFHIGYVTANTDYENGSHTDNDTVGSTVGFYGGWWRNGLTFDGTVNANLLSLDHRFGTNPKDLEESDSTIQSLGLRVEAGYRLPVLGERLYVQPLATVAYASADIKELELRDNDLSFEDATSLRTGLGLRVGGAVNDSGNLGYWATLRRWEEHEGDGHVLFEVRDGADLAVRDDLSGAFNEIDLGVNWGNAEGDLSGYISGGAKFDKDDNNDSYDFSIGIRKNW